jgi:hypothetical protein
MTLSRRNCLQAGGYLLSTLLFGCGRRSAANERASRFVLDALVRDRMGLDCFVNDTTTPAPVHATGWVFSAHFVVSALAASLTPEAKRLCVDRLLASCERGAWGYAIGAPADSDDTALAARTLRLLGAKAPYDLSRFHCATKALYRTFPWGGSDDIEIEPSERGNRGIHPEVNFNIAELLASEKRNGPSLAPVLEACVARGGAVKSYFYPSDYYGCYWLTAAAAKGGAIPTSVTQKVLEFIAGSQERSGSWSGADPYATALAALALSFSRKHDGPRRSALRFLAESQRDDGSWSTQSVIWHYEHRAGVVWNARDSNRVVTTALALQAMS